MTTPKLIALDMDGTMLNGDSSLTRRTKEALRLRDPEKPVSYTHLDVYKRQGHHGAHLAAHEVAHDHLAVEAHAPPQGRDALERCV